MATATHTTTGTAERRVPPFAAAVMTADLRTAIAQKAEQLLDEARAALDGAAYLIDFLDAADRPAIDMEPDADGEAEPYEASLQPATLAPDRVNVVQMPRPLRVVPGITSSAPMEPIRPTRRQMAAAYRRVGAPVPVELRGILGRAWA